MIRLATVWLLPLVLLVYARAAAADELIEQIAARLEISERISGRFEQSRDVSFLSRPLTATGSFVIDAGGGLTWQVEQPVQSLMEVRDGVVSLDGQVVDDPGTGQFMVMILTAFMQRDLAPVAEQFVVAGTNHADDWQLELKPRNVLWRRVIASVALDGDSYLRNVTINETDGSATRIAFVAVSGGATAGVTGGAQASGGDDS